MAVGSNADNKASTAICPSNQQSIITISSYQDNGLGLPYQDHNYGAPPPATSSLSPKLTSQNGIVLNHKTSLKSIVSTNLQADLTSTTLMPPLLNGYRRSPVKISTSPVILKTPLEGALECICGVNRDDGFMICCNRCSSWQHMDCMNINRGSIPENYMCSGCYAREPNGRPEIVKVKMHDKISASENETEEDDDAPPLKVMYTSVQSTPTSLTITTNKNERKKINECLTGKKRKRSKDDTKKNGKRAFNHQIPLSTWEAKLKEWRESYQEIDESTYSEGLLQAVLALGSSRQQGCAFTDETTKLLQLRQQLAKVQQLRHRLMSMEDISVSQPVAELKGAYMLSRELELTEEENCFNRYPHVFFPSDISGLDVCVDTRSCGNVTRFVRKSCCSNCEIKHFFDEDRLHLFVYSKKAIANGEEITIPFDYKNDESEFADCPCSNSDKCPVYQYNHSKLEANNHVVNPALISEIDDQNQRRLSPLILTISRVHQECNGEVSPNPSSTGTGTDNENDEGSTEHRRKKSREDRKLEAYIKAFERLEQKERKKEQSVNAVVAGSNADDKQQQQQHNRRLSRDDATSTDNKSYVVHANDQLIKTEPVQGTESAKDTSSSSSNTNNNASAKRSTRKKSNRNARKGSRKGRTASNEEATPTESPQPANTPSVEPSPEQSAVENHSEPAEGELRVIQNDTNSHEKTTERDRKLSSESVNSDLVSRTTTEPKVEQESSALTNANLHNRHNETLVKEDHLIDLNGDKGCNENQPTNVNGSDGETCTASEHNKTNTSSTVSNVPKQGSSTESSNSHRSDLGCDQIQSIENSLLHMTFRPWNFSPGIPCGRVRMKSVRRYRRSYTTAKSTMLKKLWLSSLDEQEDIADLDHDENKSPSEIKSFKKRFVKQYENSLKPNKFTGLPNVEDSLLDDDSTETTHNAHWDDAFGSYDREDSCGVSNMFLPTYSPYNIATTPDDEVVIDEETICSETDVTTDNDDVCMSLKSMTSDKEISSINAMNSQINPLTNEETRAGTTVKKKVSLQEYLKRTKDTKKTTTTVTAPLINTTSIESSISSNSSDAVSTSTVSHNSKTIENVTTTAVCSSPEATAVVETDIAVNTGMDSSNNANEEMESSAVAAVDSPALIKTHYNDTPTLGSPSSSLTKSVANSIVGGYDGSETTKTMVSNSATKAHSTPSSNNDTSGVEVSAAPTTATTAIPCEDESLNAEKVLLLIKNSCEGLNTQSLTELTNAITSEDIYKNVPPEITTLITQAIKQMKDTNDTDKKEESAEGILNHKNHAMEVGTPNKGKSDGSRITKFNTESSPASGKAATPKSTPSGKHSMLSPQPSPRQSRSISLVSSPVLAKPTESTRHSSVDSLKDSSFSDVLEGGKHRQNSGTSTTSNHSNPRSPSHKEKTYHSVSQKLEASQQHKVAELSSKKTPLSPATSGQPIPSLVSRRPDSTRVPPVVFSNRRASPMAGGSPAAWDSYTGSTSQDQTAYYRATSPRTRQLSPTRSLSRPVSPRTSASRGSHSPFRASPPPVDHNYRRTSADKTSHFDWSSPRGFGREEAARGRYPPSQQSPASGSFSKYTPGRSSSPQRTEGNGHHYSQPPSRGERPGSPGPMRHLSHNYYYSKHSYDHPYRSKYPPPDSFRR